MSDCILKIENFSKSFRSHWTFRAIKAVENLSLEIKRGESFGFLGHNGAGKTTTIKSIVGLINKTQGQILLDDKPLDHTSQRQLIGYLPELPYFYDHLSVKETLDFFASLHGLKNPQRNLRITQVLEDLGLADRSKQPVKSLSKGLQQRLAFAQAILNQPKLLLLDEPFSGLDPVGRMELRKLILDLNRKGTTIFLSSHILSDVEDICSRVAIMAKGQLKTVFSLKDTAKIFGESYILVVQVPPDKTGSAEKLRNLALDTIIENTPVGCYYQFKFATYQQAHPVISQVLQANLRIEKFVSSSLRLEDVFIKITNGKL